jgi:hypothetical protein
MKTPSVRARSAPLVTESSTTRRSTAAADPTLAGAIPKAPPPRTPWAPLFRGNNLRMAVLRLRLAYIIVAVLRSTALRHVVEHYAVALRHHRSGEAE